MSSSPSGTLENAGSLFASYRGLERLHDESVTHDGALRPDWAPFATLLEELGPDELQARSENARRIVREHGITYNVYSDPEGADRPWELDIVPLLLPPHEWQTIELGLTQRATLLNLILKDLYGPQELLRTGALPPVLVFGNPAFLRPVHGVRVARNIYLHLHGTDVARSPAGDWWVLADRTQSPSGTGYALENRIVSARVLPEEYRQSQVQRLAPFFAAQRETLRALAPKGAENPHIVLLTPGPYNETYFEHAYLARYLGFTLVEGGDLTVRDQHVYLKTLEGLQKVDVILRRVDDTFCDPLELREDSFLGVAGLVQAARAGSVTIANALGSTLLESPAFLAFLPTLCQRLLGEELLIPSVATWWCGQAAEQRYVLDHLSDMVVKPAFGPVAQLPFFGRNLTKAAREKLAADIRARPFAYVGQEQVGFSTVPTWVDGKLEPRGVAVRFYAAATGDGYSIMPGGLTRISGQSGNPVLTMQSGGSSKDLWVLSDRPVAPVTLLTPSGQPATHTRISTELPSRVADSLFWLGRYSERLESTLRLLRCLLAQLSDEGSAEVPGELSALAEMLVLTERLPKKFAGRIPFRKLEAELLQLVYNPARIGGVRELVLRLRQIASTVRDRLSIDTWRILTQLQLDSKTRAGRLPLANALNVCNTLILDLAAFSGMEMENMTRAHGWRFLDFGRRLERAYNLADLLRASLFVDEKSALTSVLEFADSTMTYRRRYFAELNLGSVLEVLAADRTNPRSLSFQLDRLQDHALGFPELQSANLSATVPQQVAALSTKLLQIQSNQPADRARELLKELLSEIASDLSSLSDQITKLYFCHTLSVRIGARL